MFRIGTTYKRQKIHEKFGGQTQYGISTSAQYPFIFLFSSPNGKTFGYEDKWINSTDFQHAGHGQIGDMKFLRGNKAIKEHKENNKQIHLFTKNSNCLDYTYQGELSYVSYEFVEGLDITGSKRKIILFTLRKITT